MCQSEWVELRADVKHITATVDKLEAMLQGNGGAGIRVQVDRNTRTLGAMTWVIGVLAIGFTGALIKWAFETS